MFKVLNCKLHIPRAKSGNVGESKLRFPAMYLEWPTLLPMETGVELERRKVL